MIGRVYADGDVVTGLIGYCHQSREAAENLYQRIIVEHNLIVELPQETIRLTEEQYNEFVERFSAEVGTRIWESKRLKT
jgi:hypothetical protein